ncbi:MAG: VWA domain-containing protein, partial [Verrucomicrobiales bacterium]|nr:VWA domain-containing protein [Verrucomicrobiales bacterium]
MKHLFKKRRFNITFVAIALWVVPALRSTEWLAELHAASVPCAGPYAESAHPYANNVNQSWTNRCAGAEGLLVTFDRRSSGEGTRDKLYITDANGKPIQGSPFGLGSLAGQTKAVPGDTMVLRLTSDSSVTGWGFAVATIERGQFPDLAGGGAGGLNLGRLELTNMVMCAAPYPESAHPYANNVNHSWTNRCAGAEVLLVTFDTRGAGEGITDKLYVMDGAGDPIDGSPFGLADLADQTKAIPGDTVVLRLTSDRSVTGWGFAVSKLEAGQLVRPSSLVATSRDPVQIDWAVVNRGEGIATPSWVDRVYFSTDAIWDNADLPLTPELPHNTPLASMASYARQTVVNMPEVSLGEGLYYLIIRTDARGQLGEGQEANNEMVVPVQMILPDLVVQRATLPLPVATPRETLRLNWSVTNLGQVAALPPWVNRVYFSSDSTWDSSDATLATERHSATLAAGATNQLDTTVNLPNVPDGSYFIILRTDADEEKAESDESNNTAVVGVTVQTPDLAVDMFHAFNASNPFTNMVSCAGPYAESTHPYGNNVDQSWTNRCAGAEALLVAFDPRGAGEDAADRLYITDGDGNPIEGSPFGLRMLAAQTKVVPGDTVVLRLTSDRSVTGWGFAVTKIEGGKLATRLKATPLNTVSVQWRVRNIGKGTAQPQWNDRLFLSTDAVLDPQDLSILPGWQRASALLTTNGYVRQSQTRLRNTLPGEYFLILKTDSLDELSEANEQNNWQTVKVSLEAPVLRVGDLAADEMLGGGDKHYYRVQVEQDQALLRVQLKGDSAFSANELYLRYGAVPTLDAYDFVSRITNEGSQVIDVPAPLAGDYFAMVAARQQSGTGNPYRIYLPLAPLTTAPSEIADLRVTVEKPSSGSIVTTDLISVSGRLSLHAENGADATDIILVLDTSGSLGSNDPMDHRKTAATQLLNTIPSGANVQVGLVDFDDAARLVQSLTNDLAAVRESLKPLDQNGGTRADEGIFLALEELQLHGRTNSNQMIILFSDGESDTDMFPSAVEANRRGVLVHSVFLGRGETRAALAMRDVARSTFGTYQGAAVSEDLLRLFSKVSLAARVDRLELVSDAEPSKVITPTVAVDFWQATSVPVRATAGAKTILTVTAYTTDSPQRVASTSVEVMFGHVPSGNNKPPTLDPIENWTILEDAPLQTVNLTGITTGAANEVQSLTIDVASSNPALIPKPQQNYASPNATGSLSFRSTANANGMATITVTVKDNGGTADGGQDTTTRHFTVTVTKVNDPPTFTKGPDQTVPNTAGSQTIAAWATNFKAGPADEANQVLTFEVTTDRRDLFSVEPAITPSGSLTFRPRLNAKGIATVTVILRDAGGTAEGGIDKSVPQEFTITVAESNRPPTPEIVQPSDKGKFRAQTPIKVQVISADPDPDDRIVNLALDVHDLDRGALDTLTSADGNFTLTNLVLGRYELQARATDSGGLEGTSHKVSFEVLPICAPFNTYFDERQSHFDALVGTTIEIPVALYPRYHCISTDVKLKFALPCQLEFVGLAWEEGSPRKGIVVPGQTNV